jgi:tRNA threonylcarbamoyl adenosine modification protein YjeE
MLKIISKSPAETIRLGKHLARMLQDGDLVALIGILGAGKTYFTKGIAQGLGVSKKHQITSPSYVLGNLYFARNSALYHFDAYRIDNPKELFGLGLDESYLPAGQSDSNPDGHTEHVHRDSNKTVTVLEWADRLLPLISKGNHAQRIIRVTIKVTGEKERLITLSFGNRKLDKELGRYLSRPGKSKRD